MSPLKGGRLDARDFILPEIQMLQLRQLLEETIRFDLVQFIVAQQSGARTHKRKKIHVERIHDDMIAPKCSCVLRYVCIVSQTANRKKKREREREKSEIGTCRSLLHHLFSTTRQAIYSLYRVITMRRPINFANCALE